MSFVHLHCHTPFSFLDGASPVAELVQRAVELDMPALALTDHNNLSAAVQFAQVARQSGLKAIQGVEVSLADGSHLTLLAQNRQGYASLCRLVTAAHLNHPRGQAVVANQDSGKTPRGDSALRMSPRRDGPVDSAGPLSRRPGPSRILQVIMGAGTFLYRISRICSGPATVILTGACWSWPRSWDLEVVASNNVHYTRHEDYFLHDLLCCVKKLCTVNDIDPDRPLNGAAYLKSPGKMQALFAHCPQALDNTLRIAERCQPFLQEPVFHFPRFPLLPARKLPWFYASWPGKAPGIATK